MASFAFLVALTYLIPGFLHSPVVNHTVETIKTGPVVAAGTPTPTPLPARPGEIEDPSGRALDAFFASLNRTERGAGRVVITHYGDSPITNDGITLTVRRKLQARFGDAGHGFVLPVKPWGWYAHDGIEHLTGRGWDAQPIFISRGDHRFGLGGASLTASSPDATATIALTPKSKGAIEVYYLAQPGGGDFVIEVDEIERQRVATGSAETRSGFQRQEIEAGNHRLTIRPAGNGEARIFGVTIDAETKGVVYDSLGANGAFIGLLANYLDAEHWTEQLRHRQPALVVIGYGANESQFESLPMDRYERDTREVVRRIKTALPQASILFFGPMDRGERGAGGALVTRRMIPKLVDYQRRLAAETGCAFFDTFTAMGGEGTVARWAVARPKLMGGDWTHPTAQGSEVVGTLLYDALMKAYENYRAQGSGVAVAQAK
jgi:lysophospholipase L1-like esterase